MELEIGHSLYGPYFLARRPAHPEQKRIHTMTSLLLRPRACAGRRTFPCARCRLSLCLAAIALALFGATSSAIAADRFWFNSSGGAFGTTGNWSATTGAGSVGGASVPGAADVANFLRASNYTVTFAADATNAGLLISNDSVTFDLGGKTYTNTASTNIGTTLRQTGRLTVKNGTLAVDTATDQIFVGATGVHRLSDRHRLAGGSATARSIRT